MDDILEPNKKDDILELNNYISQLYDLGRRCYRDLNEGERKHLTALIMRFDFHQTWEFLTEAQIGRDCDNKTALKALEEALLSASENQAEHAKKINAFWEIFSGNCARYVSAKIDEFFLNHIDDVEGETERYEQRLELAADICAYNRQRM